MCVFNVIFPCISNKNSIFSRHPQKNIMLRGLYKIFFGRRVALFQVLNPRVRSRFRNEFFTFLRDS